MSITALALFSGGLDSILACRVVMAQGVRVVALRFITPFFEADVGDVAGFTVSVQEKYGIEEADLYSAELQAVPAGPARFGVGAIGSSGRAGPPGPAGPLTTPAPWPPAWVAAAIPPPADG